MTRTQLEDALRDLLARAGRPGLFGERRDLTPFEATIATGEGEGQAYYRVTIHRLPTQ